MVETINDAAFEVLCQQLAVDRKSQLADGQDNRLPWPGAQLARMADAGVYRWFVPADQGGAGWSVHDLTLAYLKMSQACLASTFVLTQRIAALKRVVVSANRELVQHRLPLLINGQAPATVGISHLTTSGQHLREPVLIAKEVDDGFVLNGFCPWVTGANDTEYLLVGACVDDGAADAESRFKRQILALVSTRAKGVSVDPGFDLIALSETHTGRVQLADVVVSVGDCVAGPIENALASLSGAPSTGSYQSSALALGVAAAAIEYLKEQAGRRPDLLTGAESLQASHRATVETLLQATRGDSGCSNEQLRADANSLVLRSTQAAMVAAKGAGFTCGHPVGRWCQEAMFFLVWSCPQAVQDANLCELAGVE